MILETKKQNNYRPVLFCANSGQWERGIFHEWGYNNMSVGIVEDAEGNVRTLFPWKIRFLDSQEQFDQFAWSWNADEE